MKSTFNVDIEKEKKLGKWLDSYLYNSEIWGNTTTFQRATHIDDQKKGIDIIIETDTKTFIVDEKATLHYINKNIPTFAFELLNRTSQSKGWLFNSNYRTTHYILAWPNAIGNDFTSSEIMLIDRRKLIDSLKSNGITEDFLNKKIETLSPQLSCNNYKHQLNSEISLYFTQTLAEKPVNLIIHKKFLKQIAEFYKRIP